MKIYAIILILTIMVSLSGCGAKTKINNTPIVTTKRADQMSTTELESIAKQSVVDHCCKIASCSRVSIDFGTLGTDNNGVTIAKGTFRPIDEYGKYGKLIQFDITLRWGQVVDYDFKNLY